MDTGRRIALYGALGIAALGAAYGVGRLTLGPALAEARSGNTLINQEVPSHYLLRSARCAWARTGRSPRTEVPMSPAGCSSALTAGVFRSGSARSSARTPLSATASSCH